MELNQSNCSASKDKGEFRSYGRAQGDIFLVPLLMIAYNETVINQVFCVFFAPHFLSVREVRTAT